MQWTGQKAMFDLRKEIFRHLQHMHIAYYDKNPVGRLVTRVTTDVDALNEMFTSGVVSIFEDIFCPDWNRSYHRIHELEACNYHSVSASRDRDATNIFRISVRILIAVSAWPLHVSTPHLQEHVSGMVVLAVV